MSENCGDCKYNYNKSCRRYPPQITSETKSMGLGTSYIAKGSEWPIIHIGGYCGEFQPSKAVLEAEYKENVEDLDIGLCPQIAVFPRLDAMYCPVHHINYMLADGCLSCKNKGK